MTETFDIEPRDTDPVAEARARLASAAGAPRIHVDSPLGARTTYRVGGSAALSCEITSYDELSAVAAVVAETGVSVLVVGRGSNLLVADAGFAGLALALGGVFAAVAVRDDAAVEAGGAAALPVVARTTASVGLRGFEWAVGVPGTIGGAVRMNAGGHGSDIAASLVLARVVDLAAGSPPRDRPASDLALGYRTSAISDTEIVLSAVLQLCAGDAAEARHTIDEIVRWRREHQPGGQNAGSVFTNPSGDSAGRLIDSAGLKGVRVGSARVSPKHANFIIADEGGTASDVRALMDVVRHRVHDVHGVWLHTETRLVGFPSTASLGGPP
jgi:UDP-N-acetylmuramate dehydrogenase